MRLVLASASPRRADLLRTAGYVFGTIVVDVDESVRAGEVPHAYVERLACEKSAAALARVAPDLKRVAPDLKVGPTSRSAVGPSFSSGEPGAGSGDNDVVVLGADTAVVVDGEILGKPVDDDDARAMLQRLSGREHEVLTGVSVRSARMAVAAVETTTVWFAPLKPEEVDWYVASREGLDKAGGYAIQGLASRFIPRIAGSYTNVVGLPVALVTTLLARLEGRG
jgi:septum formation protein